MFHTPIIIITFYELQYNHDAMGLFKSYCLCSCASHLVICNVCQFNITVCVNFTPHGKSVAFASPFLFHS